MQDEKKQFENQNGRREGAGPFSEDVTGKGAPTVFRGRWYSQEATGFQLKQEDSESAL